MLASEDGRVDEAIRLYEEALEIEPRNIIAANNLAYHYVSRPGADLTKALRLAERSVRLDPEIGATHDTLATVLRAMGRLEEAADEAEAAMRCDPGRYEVFLNAAETLKAAGRDERAREVAARALELAPEPARAEVRTRLKSLGLID
jgi:tetratricopeptide (TPR) repeat protein